MSLEQVYGAITFYLGHKDEVDDDMAARERVEDEGHPAPAHLKEKWSARGVIADAAHLHGTKYSPKHMTAFTLSRI